MKMGTNDADNEEGLNEDKPFSPMYPVFNFGQPTAATAPPAYEHSSPPPIGFQEKKGF